MFAGCRVALLVLSCHGSFAFLLFKFYVHDTEQYIVLKSFVLYICMKIIADFHFERHIKTTRNDSKCNYK